MSPPPARTPSHGDSLAEVLPLRAGRAEPDGRDIVEAILRGHPQGAARLYDAFARDIHLIVRRTLGPDAEHEDLVHEVFIKAWRLIVAGKLREPEKVGAWLRGLAVNGVYKEIRRRYVRRRFLRRECAVPTEATGGPGDDRDLIAVLYRVAELMTPSERLAFALRHLEQRSLLEVAKLLDCSLATAKRRIAKAEVQFRHLSRQFEDEYPALRTLFAARVGSEP